MGTIYFIAGGDPRGQVFYKIGYTAGSATDRLKAIQTGHPYPLDLQLTMPGDMKTERSLHRRFSHLHERGEWFRDGPDLADFLRSKWELARG